MSEPCDLPAVEARRLIGQHWLAASELQESRVARMKAVGHRVNAIRARDFSSVRATAKRAGAAVTRGKSLPALHGLPIGIEDLEDTAGLRVTRLRLRT
ncbi:MAG TPA: amidase family protein [Acetobacteraceae bacterium]|nr:amidase family protein [Acetobacteraceae bacterium]